MRAFFCLPLDEDVRAAIGRAAERIQRQSRMAATWVEPANYHVTLRFLGDIDPELTVELRDLAVRAAALTARRSRSRCGMSGDSRRSNGPASCGSAARLRPRFAALPKRSSTGCASLAFPQRRSPR